MSSTCPPIALLKFRKIGIKLIIEDASKWMDSFPDHSRSGKFIFFRNMAKVAETPFRNLNYLLGDLGTNSNNKLLNLPNGVEDIKNYLNAKGVNINVGDQISISRHVQNGYHRQSMVNEAPFIHFQYQAPPAPVLFQIQITDISGDATNTIDFANTNFDLTDFGGLANESLADATAFEDRVEFLTGILDWTYNDTTGIISTTIYGQGPAGEIVNF